MIRTYRPGFSITVFKAITRAVRRTVFLAESALRYANATDNAQAASEAADRITAANTALAVIQAEQRTLKAAKQKRTARNGRPITISDLNEAVTRILTALAAQPGRSEQA